MATPDSSESGAGSAREEAERLVAAVLARASEGASQAAWMAQGAKFAARASGHQTTSTGLGMLGDALRGVATAASGYSEDLQKASHGTKPGRATDRAEADTAHRGPGATPAPAGAAAPGSSAEAAAPVVADAPGPVKVNTVPEGKGANGGHTTHSAADPQPGTAGSQPGTAGSQHGWAGPQRGGGFATGSPECCVCPVCRAITMVRNPTPEFAEQLATSAGDLAAGVAGLLRAFSTAAADTSNWSTGGPTSAGSAGSGPASTGTGEGSASAGSTGSGPAADPETAALPDPAPAAVPTDPAAVPTDPAAARTAPADGAEPAAEAADLGKPAGRVPHEDSGTGWPAADPWSAATRAAAAVQPTGDPWAAATRDTHAGHPADNDVPGTGDHGRDFREAG
ncbi:hypothetical protein ACIA8K_02175 [Catenuloplanes sp. NPDC051500]|uniref:hypothetical protein n=1 Tax=Catenuloplanes sp. NPDC051500 TaxID=3363959 RepID=UPI0037B85A39